VKKTYNIFSENLKQSLRDIVHSTASQKWQISHTLGQSEIEYKIKEGDSFGFYRKNLARNSVDEFTVSTDYSNQIAFNIFGKQKDKEKPATHRWDEEEESRQTNEPDLPDGCDKEEALRQGDTIFTFRKDKKGQLISEKERLVGSPKQPLSEWQKSILGAVFSGVSEGFGQSPIDNLQQAQIVQKEELKKVLHHPQNQEKK